MLQKYGMRKLVQWYGNSNTGVGLLFENEKVVNKDWREAWEWKTNVKLEANCWLKCRWRREEWGGGEGKGRERVKKDDFQPLFSPSKSSSLLFPAFFSLLIKRTPHPFSSCLSSHFQGSHHPSPLPFSISFIFLISQLSLLSLIIQSHHGTPLSLSLMILFA